MLPTATLNWQVTMIDMNSDSHWNCQNRNRCLKCHKFDFAGLSKIVNMVKIFQRKLKFVKILENCPNCPYYQHYQNLSKLSKIVNISKILIISKIVKKNLKLSKLSKNIKIVKIVKNFLKFCPCHVSSSL